MKFNKVLAAILLAAAAVLLFVQVPHYASAQTNASLGYVDKPISDSTLTGIQSVNGWFLDSSGVEKIEVLVDGAIVGQAIYGDPRPDVKKAYPQYNNGNAGFHYDLDTTRFNDGPHSVMIRATNRNGQVTALPPKTITFNNVIGYIDNPSSGSTLTGTQKVHGWFLDKSGVAKIEVFVDDTLVGQATYGDPRSDVKKFYPQFNNGNAGYHFDLDTTKFPDGEHTLTIKETGNNGKVTSITASKISIENVLGYIDKIGSGSVVNGSQKIHGWFLDKSGVEKIEILVNNAVVGQAVYGDSRPDVKKFFPQFNNGEAGFHYILDTTKFPDGQHTITIRETGKNGIVTTLPSGTITVDNVLAYLDKPGSGALLTGTQNVSGWFLDESGVASIEVLVDDTVVGNAVYGDARPDVLKYYPQFNNGNAGFHFALDTTRFPDGPHTITVREIGKNGFVTTSSTSKVTIKNVVGYLDNPLSGAKLRGNHIVSGWFLDAGGVEKIEVLVDGNVVGRAIYGDPRADVQKFYPQFNNGHSGFHYLLDTTKFNDGQHAIAIRETNKNGSVTTLSANTVTFSQTAYTVFLDPGHGGTDPGAMAGGYKEANLNLAVAKKVQSLLVNRGYTVYMSRNDATTTVDLLERSRMANNLKPDIFVSIHTNSTAGGETSANGIESYFYKYFPEYPPKINEDMHDDPERIARSIALTNILQGNLVEYTGANDRGTDGDTFSVLRESAMPAILIEMGFINHTSERQKLITDSYQNKIAKAIADGIDEYFRSL